MTWQDKIKLSEINKDANLSSARYSLNYGKALAGSRDKARTKFEIISSLLGNNDLIIEVDTSLFCLNKGNQEELIEDMVENLKMMDIKYYYQKSPGRTKNGGLLSFLSTGSKQEEHKISAYLPQQIWNSSTFQQIIPAESIMYYVLEKRGSDADHILDKFQNMMDKEKHRFFKLIIFDNLKINIMGINSFKLELSDLEELLSK